MTAPPAPPGLADIQAAAMALAGLAVRTPLLPCPALSARLDARVFVKAETLQRTGSFKVRGAYTLLARLPPAVRARGVVAHSSGNHAQGVADAARHFGVPAAIVMPSDAPPPKIAGTRARGAEVILYDRAQGDRLAIAEALAAERGAVLVPPFDHPDIIAGQGTAGLEVVEDLDRLGLSPDIVLVPTSGGGLLAGTCLGLGALVPEARIHPVEPEGYDDTARSLAAGRRVRLGATPPSLCDALLLPEPGALTFPVNAARAAEGLVVSEESVRRALAHAERELKLVVEPGGAVGLAALLAGRVAVSGRTVVVLLTGGNVAPALLAEILRTQTDTEPS
ncbi:MAG: threonine/serine dehydratase [Alphaproteobacteria bacterium]|nr:threonine/serine dehydratase [Alphaproteobacteria bacterium]